MANISANNREFIEKYGSYSSILRLTFAEIQELEGINEADTLLMIKIQNDFKNNYRKLLASAPFTIYNESFQNYCLFRLQRLKREFFLAFFLDKENRLISDEIINIGDDRRVYIYPDDIIERTKFHKAKGVIVVHNHPSGTPTPSIADMDFKIFTEKLCNRMEVDFLGSLIVAGDRVIKT